MSLLTQLKELGYSAKLVNGTCYDIDQHYRTHYLSPRETAELVLAPLEHPVKLQKYAEWGGLNWWYDFGIKEKAK